MSEPDIGTPSVNPGDIVTVMVGGRPYDTVMDDRGTQRFVADPDNALLARLRNRSDGRPASPGADIADLNEMSLRYQRGAFSQREYAEMNMALGYSLEGFHDLSSFADMDIVNPLEGPAPTYDPTDVATCPLSLSRGAWLVLAAVLRSGEDELRERYNGPKAARDEARAAVDEMLAIIGGDPSGRD